MKNTLLQELQKRMKDYIRFGHSLLLLGVFLYLNLLIPNGEKVLIQLFVMNLTIILSLLVSFIFYKKAFRLKRYITELNE